MQNNQEIEQELSEEEIKQELSEEEAREGEELNIIESELYELELEEHSQKMVQQQEQELSNHQSMEVESAIKLVKNPISPYMVFISQWKRNHPEDKFSVSAMG